MKKIVYAPVYIDGKEENLPKKEGLYMISEMIDGKEDIQFWNNPRNQTQKEIWLRSFTFWLKPVELPDGSEIEKIFTPDKKLKDSFEKGYYAGLIAGAKWLLNKLTE